ncbi:MAG: nitrile hydratase subunit beta [Acidimicrobiales bacterium]
MTAPGTYRSWADLGGTPGHVPVAAEVDEPVFHTAWEGTALALTVASGTTRRWNLDMSRRFRETVPDYPDLSYYQIWVSALERLVIERGVATEAELAAGHAAGGRVPGARALTADRVEAAMNRGAPTLRDVDRPARFVVGDRVTTRPVPVGHHTRLPHYAAGRTGTVESVHGAHVFPDTNAHDEGEQPQWLYTVAFDAADLWSDAHPGHRVSIDAWEPYLAPADPTPEGRRSGPAPA